MQLNRRFVLSGSAGALAAGCSSLRRTTSAKPSFAPYPVLRPLNIERRDLTRITVCLRPFRAAGPRIETEQLGDKRVVHNYGHGGSGWSLSWGCAEQAANLVMEGDAPWQVAVIGAGAIGLTTALTLAERGLDVTIYAKDLPAHAPSAWATGVWSPSSRIGLESAVPDSFTEEWLAWGRYSLARHEQFVGALGDPVELRQSFILRDDPRPPSVPSTRDFLHLGSRVRNPGPRMRNLEAHEHPFNVAKARGGIGMSFNIARYTESLVSRFYQRGGQIIQREFHDLNAVQALDETVIVNCTGYGAKALWGDDSLSPVRGQINWFPPHKGERYSLYYSNIFAIARTDGTLVQYTGPNDDYGFGVEDLTPDIGECERTIATLASVF